MLVASCALVKDPSKYHPEELALGKEAKAEKFQPGKALAVVRIDDDAPLAEAKARGWGESPWAHGPYAYHIDAVHVLKEPVPVKGNLGAFRLPPDARAAVARQLPGGAAWSSSSSSSSLPRPLLRPPLPPPRRRFAGKSRRRCCGRGPTVPRGGQPSGGPAGPVREAALAAPHHARGQGRREPHAPHLHHQTGDCRPPRRKQPAPALPAAHEALASERVRAAKGLLSLSIIYRRVLVRCSC